ncbi:MAG: Ig-like domain-containing protein [Caldiserica bacterium]|nr:Ig-like domain-containing protein [Caldisericota bacterium]
MRCNNCGQENPEGSRYCNYCGEPLTPSLPVKTYTVKVSRKKKRKQIPKLPLIFVGLLVILCILVYLIYRIFIPSPSSSTSEIVRVKVDPSFKQLTTDASLNFSLIGTQKDGREIKIKEGVTWKVEPPEIGTIEGNGLFKPSSPGEATVEASYKELSATARVKVIEAANVSKISIYPSNVTLSVNEEQQFRVKAEDKLGNEVDVQPQWSVLEKDIGTIDPNGLFRALKPGNATILATYKMNNAELSAYAGVIVKEGPPSPVRRIEISPTSIELKKGEIYQFLCRGFDQNDNPKTVTPSWAVIGTIGTIDENGNFTAQEEGSATIQAIFDGMTATAEVTVSLEGLSFERYTFQEVNSSFDFPSNWTLQEGGRFIKLTSPTQTDTLFAYTLILGYEELQEGTTLEDYVQENKDWAKGKFPEATFQEEDKIYGEAQGKILTLTAPKYKALIGCSVSNHWGFYFFGYSPEGKFDQYESTFRRVLNGWYIPSTGTPTQTPTPSGPQTFTSTNYGFSFTYPATWQLGNLPGVVVYLTGEMVGNYLPNMTVKVEELTTPMTSMELAFKIEKERLQNFFEDYQSVSLQEVSLGNITGVKRVFTLTFQGQPLKDIQYYVVKGNLGYLITFDVSLEGFEQMSGVFEQIASSFTFQ